MTLNSQYLMSSLFASLWVLALSTADICSFHIVGRLGWVRSTLALAYLLCLLLNCRLINFTDVKPVSLTQEGKTEKPK